MLQIDKIQLAWLGHDGFFIHGTKNIYIDPFQIEPRDKPAADYMLITHNHYDHMSIADVEAVINENTIVFCPSDCSSKLSKLRMKQLKIMEPGDTFEDESVTITAVPAYNVGKQFHPRENDWLGYLVTLDKTTIYHSGDTDAIPEMRDIECDVALLPVSGTYVMTAEEAAKIADVIKPELCIPMHWGNLIGTREDAERFKKLTKCKTIIIEKE